MKNYHRTEGILLHMIPLQQSEQIISCFTLDEGLIKLVARGKLPPALSRIEVVYQLGRGDLFKCWELSLLDSYTSLKHDFKRLDAACDLLRAVQESQWVGKPAPLLYRLLTSYLDKIAQGSNPEVLTLSFRLKLLRYEGLMRLPLSCSICDRAEHSQLHFSKGAFFCDVHAPLNASLISPEECDLFYLLMLSQSHSELEQGEVSESFKEKIKLLFLHALEQ